MTDEHFRIVTGEEAVRANRREWDRFADEYQSEHGEVLGDARFLWCPEGSDEADLHLLGDVSGLRVLEIGCGAGQCARWLQAQGASVVGVDLSFRQLQHSRRIDEDTGIPVATACATATALPVLAGSMDIACSAFGAFPFIVDIDTALREAWRVLRPAGRLVFSVVHPVRRMFPDDPTEAGLTVTRSYFDRASYVETDELGIPSYVEPHHTVEDWTRATVAAGFHITALHEPTWPAGRELVWGAWGPRRGAFVPGTLIISAERHG